MDKKVKITKEEMENKLNESPSKPDQEEGANAKQGPIDLDWNAGCGNCAGAIAE